MTEPIQAVAQYYDQNTRRFLRLGGSGDLAAIHRQVWGPGVSNAQQAFVYVNQLVAGALRDSRLDSYQQTTVLDLGCGVGGTATWLAGETNLSVVGISNSALQVQSAQQRAKRLGLIGRCHFLQADFHNLPEVELAAGAYAIESFAHSPEPTLFFNQIAAKLAPGGRLVIIDDFLGSAPGDPALQKLAARWVERFQTGWQLASLMHLETAQDLAQQAGLKLVSISDLTLYLRPLGDPWIKLVGLFSLLPIPGHQWGSWAGGIALQRCIKEGWTRYQMLVWEKI